MHNINLCYYFLDNINFAEAFGAKQIFLFFLDLLVKLLHSQSNDCVTELTEKLFNKVESFKQDDKIQDSQVSTSFFS